MYAQYIILLIIKILKNENLIEYFLFSDFLSDDKNVLGLFDQ